MIGEFFLVTLFRWMKFFKKKMFDFRPAVSEQLRDILDKPDATVPEVLAEDSCLRGFNQNDSALISFLTDRISDVLDTALYSEDPKMSSKALALFSKDNDVLVREVIENNLLRAASSLVFSPQTDYAIISRFAYVTQLVCLQEPANCLNNCPYIYQFLNYCGYRLVLGMFEELFQDPEKSDAIQSQLNQFVSKLKQLVCEDSKTFSENVDDPNAVTVSGYFKLVSVIKDAPFYKVELRDPETIAAMARSYQTKNITVLDAQWAAVSDIITVENATALIPLFQTTIIPTFLESDPQYFHQYQASLLNVILVIAQSSEEIRKVLIDLNFHVVLRDIIQQFPHHTLAHMAVSNFILQSVKMEEFETLILSVIIPFAEEQMVKEQPPIELRAFIWDLFRKFEEAIANGEMSEKFKETFGAFDQQCGAKLAELTEISKKEYGGALPEVAETSPDEDTLSALTPDQIMQLLKFLSNGPMRR